MRWWNRQRKKPVELSRFDPRRPLLYLSPCDPIFLADCYTGFSVLGGTGSGKTSSLAHLALALMKIGSGFVWACAKPEEIHLVRRIARAAGRENDVVVFGEDVDGKLTDRRFNAIDYEGKRAGGTLSLVAYLGEMARCLSRARQSGGEDGPFWRDQFELLTGYCIDAAQLAGLPLSIQLLRDIQKSAPTNPEELGSETWKAKSVLLACLKRAEQRVNAGEVAEHDLTRVLDYWLKDYFKLDPKPRSSIDVMFAKLADNYSRDPIRTLLTTETNVTPEDAMNGKIIVLSLPTRKYFEPGRLAQFHFKYSFQRSMLTRSMSDEAVPCCLWCDEAHNFIADFDREYQAEVRSFRGVTVYLEQGIAGYETALGAHSEKAVDAFLTNLATKLFFQNSSPESNKFAAEVIGRKLIERTGGSGGSGPGGSQAGSSWHDEMDYQVQPREFSELKTGGYEHNRLVEAVVYKRGTIFGATGQNFLKATFQQTDLTK
jgi:type IV secretory pathway TraG/TraD family ATPase VirD4